MARPKNKPADRSLGAPIQNKHRRRRTVLMAGGGLGVVALIAGVGRSTLTSSIATFTHINWIWVGVAAVAEVASMAAFARVQSRLVRAGGADLRFRTCLPIVYASNALSVSLPVVGPEMAVAFEFRQFSRRGIDQAVAAWALAIAGIISSAALSLVFVGGALASGNATAAVAGFVAAGAMLIPAVAVVVALRSPTARRLMNRLLRRLIAVTRRCIKRPGPGADESLERFLDRIDTLRLSRPQYVEVFGLALWNWIADSLCLAAAIKATGGSVPWPGLLLAYGGAMTAGGIGLTPGGLGVVEATLTAALVAAGLNSHHALSGVLVYRLMSFWLVMAAGWAFMAVLKRRSRSHFSASVVSSHDPPMIPARNSLIPASECPTPIPTPLSERRPNGARPQPPTRRRFGHLTERDRGMDLELGTPLAQSESVVHVPHHEMPEEYMVATSNPVPS